jgi:signal transduction histidine kinase
MAAEDQAAVSRDDRIIGCAAPPPDPRPALLRLARRGLVVTSLIGLAAVCAAAFALWQMRQHHVDAAVRNLVHVARGLSEQTSREITEADQDLARIIGAALLQPERLQNPEQRSRVMARNVASTAQAAAIAYIDPEGRAHVYSRPGASSAPVFPRPAAADGLIVRDGSDREPPGLYLQHTLALRNGAPGGIVIVRLSEDYLANVYRAWRGDSPMTVSLTTLEQRSLLESPQIPGAAGRPFSTLGAASPTRIADGAAVRYTDPADGRARLVATRQVEGFPLLVHAAVAEDDVLAQWASQSALLAAATFTLVLMALLFAWRHASELQRRAGAVGQLQALQSALEAEEAKLQTIVRTVPSAVFQARLGGRRTIALSFMSARIEMLWGVPAQLALKHPRRALWKVPRAHRRQLLEGLSEAVLQGTGWDVTVPVQTSDGMRWLRIHAAPGEERDGVNASVWDGIISDVTEQKVAEQKVVLLNLDLERRVIERTRELAELNRELEAFTDSVSHDLRAPLRGMRGYAEILKSAQGVPPEAAGLAERIIAQGDHMEQLIEALLELSQISRYDLRRMSTDITDIAASTLRNLQSRDAERTVRFEVEPGLRAYADPRLMRVLFDNLLGNAWKFTRERSDALIEIGRTTAERRALFVRDNGAGFDPAFAARLFQPFQRLHPATRFEGTGIGLATVQRIVRRHGGRIWAESKPDAGATFFIELPMESGVNYTRGA